jgi:acetyl-CoA acetyltransferase
MSSAASASGSPETYVLGVGMTPFGRHLDRSLADLATAAVREALSDACVGYEAIQAVIVGNAVQGAMDGQHGIRGQLMLRELPLGTVPVVNVENACASASSALHLAVAYVGSGMADVVLAVGAEKMVSLDRQRSLDAFSGSWDESGREETLAGLAAFGRATPVPAGVEELAARSVFMDIYAAFARQHMALWGSTVEQFAAVSAKNHEHSVHNPRAQYRRPFTVEEVLAGRTIAWPLTLPMCSPVSDGAAAALICSPAAADRLGRGRAVRIRASVLGHGGGWTGAEPDEHVSARTAQRLWATAGVGPEDVDVAEVHDATAVGEVQQIEHLGLVPRGDGGPAAERGETRIGGRIPVNPSGGLESRGHPIGATGLAQVHELVTQLRGEAGPRQVEGARLAVAENGGGLIGLEEAAVAMTVLEAPARR